MKRNTLIVANKTELYKVLKQLLTMHDFYYIRRDLMRVEEDEVRYLYMRKINENEVFIAIILDCSPEHLEKDKQYLYAYMIN